MRDSTHAQKSGGGGEKVSRSSSCSSLAAAVCRDQTQLCSLQRKTRITAPRLKKESRNMLLQLAALLSKFHFSLVEVSQYKGLFIRSILTARSHGFSNFKHQNKYILNFQKKICN